MPRIADPASPLSRQLASVSAGMAFMGNAAADPKPGELSRRYHGRISLPASGLGPEGWRTYNSSLICSYHVNSSKILAIRKR
jgi:hypothetical protein